MVPYIYTPLEHHNARTPDAYLEAHAAAIAKKIASGRRERVHVSLERCIARVDHGSWIIDCECGAGNATDPAWGFACCFGCGAIHRNIVFPSLGDCAEIERILLLRSHVKNRFWFPERGETMAILREENRAHGVAD